MGTSTELKRGGSDGDESEIIPWKFVPFSVRQELIQKLNPVMTLSGNDWRMLAHKLGYNTSEIAYIESEKDNNTSVLLREYEMKPNASFNELYKLLEDMNRHDCLEILDNAKTGILEAWTKNVPSSMSQMTCGHMPWSNNGYPYPNPACMSPQPCGSHFASCPGPMNSGTHLAMGCSSYQHQSQPCQHLPHAPLYAHSRNLNPVPQGAQCAHQHFSQCCHNNTRSTQQVPGLSKSPANFRPYNDNHGLNKNLSRVQTQGTAGYHPGELGADSLNLAPHSFNRDERMDDGPVDFTHNLRAQARLPNNISVYDNSNLDSNNSSNDSLVSRQKIARQHSDDSNIPVSAMGEKKLKQTNRNNNNNGEASQPVYQNGFCAPNPMSKNRNQIDADKRKMRDRGEFESFNSYSSSSSGSSGGKSHPSSTFPMRVKVKQERGVEDIAALTISKKSTSMPQNMKPEEYRKGFMNIKVLVTYSHEDEAHGKQVLSLCKFLQDNKFACCVDCCEKTRTPSANEQWIRHKIIEADFILACISPKYLTDVSSPGASNSCPDASNSFPTNERRLHTKLIYDLMQEEYKQKLSDRANVGVTAPFSRFVPLLFRNMSADRVPPWMKQNRSPYLWPKDYLDLAWMLTKPFERIKTKKTNMEERLERDYME
ncbi:uncharacterized protein LOC131956981 isoform X2 [Physella acuta]|uniref:uncharacterized protein LOC131956981 isoform X2 n=1 Tax=Physella acuta TaxID=109671 RepID=UPI0027DB1D79|nr:uncharacterized protein LOC131956981 isoform X2 [Physella acuta]